MIYFVATPIGNLKDITYRAVEVLETVDVIACEDTRTSRILLNHYNIKDKMLISYHKFNEEECSEKIIDLAISGKNIAIISDAGMPGISDPGNILAKKLCEKQIEYTVIPGPSALICSLVLSGFDSRSFYFAGFLPEKNMDKNKVISQIITLNSTLIFYVSSHNLKKNIDFLYKSLGDRNACLTKELTKLHEQKVFFNLSSLPDIDERGEFVLIVEGAINSLEDFANKSIVDHVKFYINLGMTKNEAIKKVAKERNVNKNEVYKEVLNI